LITRWFRVPEQPPRLPARAGEEVETFRPARGFLSYLRLKFWIILLISDVGILAGWIAILVTAPGLAVVLFPVAVFLAVFPDLIAYVAIQLRYDTTWYVMNDRALRLRRGIWVITEVTITFENVQNVTVTQGPLQRFFAIADVEVSTAGGGTGGQGKGQHEQAASGAHRGLIEGVANAREIRELIVARLRRSKTAGLGDEELAVAGPGHTWGPAHVAALAAVRDELAALVRR
jgi:membrane protein YdbS with pleckstrin-like domain